MGVYHANLRIETVAGRPSYHDLRADLLSIVGESGFQDGILTVASAHTTCSLFFDETMHDTNFYGDDFLWLDINETMEKIAPRMTTEGQYHSPGPEHVAFGLSLSDPSYPAEKWVMLNTDAHIRSSIFGSPSLTFIVKDGELLLGPLGRVYFVDWDQLRERTRTVSVMVMGE